MCGLLASAGVNSRASEVGLRASIGLPRTPSRGPGAGGLGGDFIGNPKAEGARKRLNG